MEHISAGEIVAGKVFKTSSNVHPRTLTNKLFGELSLITQVHHQNVVQCKGVCLLESEAMPVLLMERLMSSLHAYLLDSTNSNLSLVTKLSILYDVAKGLVYLHNHKPAIIHRDLTGNNVLLDEELYGLLGSQARICVQSVRQLGGSGGCSPGKFAIWWNL